MSALTTVRAALAQTIEATLSPTWAVYPYRELAPDVPAILITNGNADPRNGYTKRSAVYPFVVTAVTSLMDTAAGQQFLDQLRERGTSTSLLDVLDSDKRLGGVAQTLTLGEMSEDQPIQMTADATYIGFTLLVDVVPSIS